MDPIDIKHEKNVNVTFGNFVEIYQTLKNEGKVKFEVLWDLLSEVYHLDYAKTESGELKINLKCSFDALVEDIEIKYLLAADLVHPEELKRISVIKINGNTLERGDGNNYEFNKLIIHFGQPLKYYLFANAFILNWNLRA